MAATPASLLVICGPTASGKTRLALELAGRLPLEVISADSRQVYRGMDIGTAKPTPQERQQLPHHLVDVVDPDQAFSAADFVRLARPAAASIRARGRLPVVVGGTGLYIRALTEGLVDAPPADPELRQSLWQQEREEGEGTLYRLLQERDPAAAARIHPRNLVRIVRSLEVFALEGRRLSELQAEHAFGERPFATLKIGLAPEREELFQSIDRRAEAMLAAGLVEEVRGLLQGGYAPELKALQTIGYRECLRLLRGELSLAETTALIQLETRRYAKRQLTWFRQDSEIIWVDSWREFARIQSLIEDFYAA
jgi:tRNA dimethylallyltransferase